MKKLVELSLDFLFYQFNYEETNNYNSKALEKYNDNVVSLRKTPKYCFVLFKGRNIFFGYKFDIRWRRVKRCIDMKVFAKSKGRKIFDKKEFGLFKRQLILDELKWR